MRALMTATITDQAGNVIQNALVNVYQQGTTTAVTDMFAASSGGSPVSTLTTDSRGLVTGWFTSPKFVDLNVTDNAHTAYRPDTPATLLTWVDYTRTVAIQPDTSTIVLSTTSAGGVLAGTYPNPTFAVDMATQAELDAEATTRASADSTLTTAVAAKAADSAVVHNTGTETVAGTKTFSTAPLVPDLAYDATTWDGSLAVPTRNAVRDKIEAAKTAADAAYAPVAEPLAVKLAPAADQRITGGYKLTLGTAGTDEPILRLASLDSTRYWALATGSQVFGDSVRDHILVMGGNVGALGARQDTSKSAVSLNMELDFVSVNGAHDTSELHFNFVAPDGYARRPYMATIDHTTHTIINIIRGALYLYRQSDDTETFIFEDDGRLLLRKASSAIHAQFNNSSWLLQYDSGGTARSLMYLDSANRWQVAPEGNTMWFGSTVSRNSGGKFIFRDDSVGGLMGFERINDSTQPDLTLYRARAAGNGHLVANDVVARYQALGWDSAAYRVAGMIDIVAESGVGGSNAMPASMRLFTNSGSSLTERVRITPEGSVCLAMAGALATSATDGFTYMPTCAGTPTGTPTTRTGMVPWVYDSTNDIIYIYRGGWKKTAALT